ncbi:MAG: hypothetical protein LBL47_01745 [Lactobacillus sp.]|jgi:hypothetical protein|nr:hypothetical protein [Lactobacillus sp.]
MFKKLLNGELSLREAFWKFGVLGLIICNIIFRISQKLLAPRLQGYTIRDYYSKHFSFVTLDGYMLSVTLFYLFAMVLLISYCIIIVMGVWRSAAEYNKSIWLRQLSRILILIFVFISLRGFIP